jgi:organic hydroperoxide reductase OsmC/OhrA
VSEHRARLAWQRRDRPFTLEGFDREHWITYEGGVSVRASSAPAYGGDATLPNPEEQLVAALSSCHMLTFLAICARKGLVVDGYDDDAVGTLGKNAEGRTALVRCELRPRARFAVEVDGAELARLHEHAHRGCFIAASVKTEVIVCTA